jgi:hypothetical protein
MVPFSGYGARRRNRLSVGELLVLKGVGDNIGECGEAFSLTLTATHCYSLQAAASAFEREGEPNVKQDECEAPHARHW